MTNWDTCLVVERHLGKLSGAWTFAATRAKTCGVRLLQYYGTKVLSCAIINSCSAGIPDTAEIGRTINKRIYQTTGGTRNAPMNGENWSKLGRNWLKHTSFLELLVSVFDQFYTETGLQFPNVSLQSDISTEFIHIEVDANNAK